MCVCVCVCVCVYVYVCVYVCVCMCRVCVSVLCSLVCTSSPGLANASNINLQCTSKWNVTSSMFTYNLTWTLNFPPYVMAALASNATVSLQVPFSGRGGRGGSSTVQQAMVPILVCLCSAECVCGSCAVTDMFVCTCRLTRPCTPSCRTTSLMFRTAGTTSV